MGSASIKKNDYYYKNNIDLDNDEIIKNSKNKLFDAYKSMKETILLINNFEDISFDAYLVSTNTIPNFIEIIKSLNILEYLITKNNELSELELKLNKRLDNYKLEKDIKLIYDYKDCQNTIRSGDEFIIVDELFCRVMEIEQYYLENKKVNINIDRSKFKHEIKFYSDNIIDFREIHTGFYKFFYEKNN